MGEVTFLDVSKRFSLRVDGEVHHVQALDRISFTVKDGEIVALIGGRPVAEAGIGSIAGRAHAGDGTALLVRRRPAPRAPGRRDHYHRARRRRLRLG